MSETTHISDERFLRLADGRSLTGDEETHLIDCSACGERLAGELQLNDMLGRLPEPMSGLDDSAFLAATMLRFENTLSRRRTYAVPLIAAALVLFGSFASLVAALAFARRIPQLFVTGVDLGVEALKAAQAAEVVVSSVPGLSAVLTVMFIVAAAVWAALLIRFFTVPFLTTPLKTLQPLSATK